MLRIRSVPAGSTPSSVMSLLLPAMVLAAATQSGTAPPDHRAWDALLREHVSPDGVDYRSLAAERARLDGYLAELERARGVDHWPREERLAFWMNAYNALVVARVLDSYPVVGADPAHPERSVLQIPGFFDELTHSVAGRTITLDQLENDVLRAGFQEPRIHFAIVCAARSCPRLRPEAYSADRLEEQLEAQARSFFGDASKNVFDVGAGRVGLSQIFRWFSEDFEGLAPKGSPARRAHGAGVAGVLHLAARYLPTAAADRILSGNVVVDFLPYDWSLNES